MGHEATGGVDGWGPVGVSLGLSLSSGKGRTTELRRRRFAGNM